MSAWSLAVAGREPPCRAARGAGRPDRCAWQTAPDAGGVRSCAGLPAGRRRRARAPRGRPGPAPAGRRRRGWPPSRPPSRRAAVARRVREPAPASRNWPPRSGACGPPFSRIARRARARGRHRGVLPGPRGRGRDGETTTTATTEMTPAGATVLDARDLQANDRTALAGALALAPGVTLHAHRLAQRDGASTSAASTCARCRSSSTASRSTRRTTATSTSSASRRSTSAELRVSKGFASVLYGPERARRRHQHRLAPARRRASRALAGVSYGSGDAGTVYVNAGSRLNAFYVQGGASYLDGDTFPLAGRIRPGQEPAGGRPLERLQSGTPSST